jgi:peptidoglycan biosynthesis protein MviN/MurJ (putative lipid II flippase)
VVKVLSAFIEYFKLKTANKRDVDVIVAIVIYAAFVFIIAFTVPNIFLNIALIIAAYLIFTLAFIPFFTWYKHEYKDRKSQ